MNLQESAWETAIDMGLDREEGLVSGQGTTPDARNRVETRRDMQRGWSGGHYF